MWKFALILLCPVRSPAADCPSAFADFLSAFENSNTYQLEHTRYPLHYSYVEMNAVPAPERINRQLGATEVKDFSRPLYPSPDKQYADSLGKEIIEGDTFRRHVRLSQRDTDYVLIYDFELVNACWMLTTLDDGQHWGPPLVN